MFISDIISVGLYFTIFLWWVRFLFHELTSLFHAVCLCFLGIHWGDYSYPLLVHPCIYFCPFEIFEHIYNLFWSLCLEFHLSHCLKAINMQLLIFEGDSLSWLFTRHLYLSGINFWDFCLARIQWAFLSMLAFFLASCVLTEFRGVSISIVERLGSWMEYLKVIWVGTWSLIS